MKRLDSRGCKWSVRQCLRRWTLLPFALLAIVLSPLQVYGETEYEFLSNPVLVAGSPLAQGATYRFDGVAEGIDALVKIALTKNATVLKIDESVPGIREAFQPVIQATAPEAFVDFEITFVVAGTTAQRPLSTIASALNVDRSAKYDQFFPVSDFTIESDSGLVWSLTAPQTLTVGSNTKEFSPEASTSTRLAVMASVRNSDSLTYRVGTKKQIRRQATLLFAPLNFDEKLFININDLPEARDDALTGDVNVTLSVESPGLLQNDTDIDMEIDSDVLSITQFYHAEGYHEAGNTAELREGHLAVNPDGSYRFVPAPNFTGSVPVVTYIVDDGKGGRDEARIQLSISSEYMPPVAVDDLVTITHSKAMTINVLDNDSDSDGLIDHDSLVLVPDVSRAAGGSILSRSGKSLFIPGEGQWDVNIDGTVSFQSLTDTVENISPLIYQVADNDGLKASASIILQNDAEADASKINIDEDINDDGWINNQELSEQLSVSFTLPASAVEGDQLTLTDGVTEQLFEIDTVALLSGTIATTFPTPIDGGVIRVEAFYSSADDTLLSSSSDQATLDLEPNNPPEVTIIADLDNSGFLSLEESVEQADVEIVLPASVVVNDRVEIRIGSMVVDKVLTPLDVANGQIVVPVTSLVEGGTLLVLVRIFDEAGNVSNVASDSVLVDTIAPVPPTVDPLTTGSSTPTISGNIRDNGDFILSVTVNGIVYASGDGNLLETGNGDWQLEIPLLDALPNGTYDVQATLIDIAGNQSVDTTVNELKVDLVVPQISASNIGPVSDPAPLVSGTTDQLDTNVVTVSTQGNVHVCEALVQDGQWACRSRILLPVGDSVLIARILDHAGNPGSTELSVTVVTSSDQDADGIPDDVDGAIDTDGDGLANFLDLDSDNDTIPDNLETAIDTDGDQIRDFMDLDSDNDSLSDLFEASFSRLVDTDGDGVVDSSILVGSNGLADVIETFKDGGNTSLPRDSDNDGLYDYIDRDSDNDGIEDKYEQGFIIAAESTTNTEREENPGPNILRNAVDSDLDGIADYLDLDSDQDGVSDVLEAMGIDSDFDGRLDNAVDMNKDGLVDEKPVGNDLDVDEDGIQNHKDLDSDDDGIADLIESGGVDTNKDGVHDGWVDINANGISDDVDQTRTNGNDADGDGIDDLFDVDFVEEQDIDSDGIVDSFDVDSNGDGRLDILDGVEFQIADANADGLPDVYEPVLPLTTGTGVFGCSLRSSSRADTFDPTMPLILLFIISVYMRRSMPRARW